MKILCPTDFSDHSLKAVHYAIQISNQLQAELHFITVYSVPRKSSSFVSLDDKIRENTEEDMNELMAGLSPLIKTDIPPVVQIFKGRIIDCILGYAKTANVDLIVMGTQGQNSMRTIIFGSVTKKIASNSLIPVLAIPEDVDNYILGSRMLLALDDKVIRNEKAFEIPVKIANLLGLQIDILHVQTDKEQDLPFDPYISAYLPNVIGEVIILNNKDIVQGIKEYSEKNKVGMIIMLRRKKGFFQRLLTVGHTSDELASTNIPLLVLSDS